MKRGHQGKRAKRHKTTRCWTRLDLDLRVKILEKLPAKSLVRFQCVSKLWLSIISSRRDFIESIMARSSRDAYLLSYHRLGCPMECFLVLSSATSPRNAYKIPILSVHEKSCQYLRGLIFCWSDVHNVVAIYNHTTRQSFYLPDMKTSHMGTYFFGYEPLEDLYKVLFLPSDTMDQACQVFTLGEYPTKRPWRIIRGVGSHFPVRCAVCINGVIYYRAKTTADHSVSKYILMSFDVKSEEFRHVDAPKTLMEHASTLINYQGKLGFVCCQNGMEIWIREDRDRKTQGWSKIFFYEMDGFSRKWRVTGATRGGEILFVNSKQSLFVFHYDPKRNSMRYVDLDDTYLGQRRRGDFVFIRTLPDYVENTMRLF